MTKTCPLKPETGGGYTEIPGSDGKYRGENDHGQDVIFNPENSGSPGGNNGGQTTIFVDGSPIRYP